ncbi:MAG: Ig-like domain-containing protein [Clostridiales bacterium]|nr:Ig-like domain-containing protein [Clostridiales bacterium]
MFPSLSVNAAESETQTINLLNSITSNVTGTTPYDCGITVAVGGGGSITYNQGQRAFSVPQTTSQTSQATFAFSITPDGDLAGYKITSINIVLGNVSNGVSKDGDFGTGTVSSGTLSWTGISDSVELDLYRTSGSSTRTARITAFTIIVEKNPESASINILNYYTAAITSTNPASYRCGINITVGGGGSMTYSSNMFGTTRQFSVPTNTSQTSPATFEFSIDPNGPLADCEIIAVSIGLGNVSNGVSKKGDFGTGTVSTNNTLSWTGKSDSVELDLYRTSGNSTRTATINSFTITIAPKSVPVESVTLSADTLELTLGGTETAELTATISPDTATTQEVEWTVDPASSIISITPSATDPNTITVTALAEGSATITASADEATASCTVTVSQGATSISIPETLTMDVGTTATLTPTIAPDGASYDSLTWSVVSGSAVTVEDGVITAGSTTGEATVRVSMTVGQNTYTDDCAVTVSIPATGVSIPESINLYRGETTTLDVTVTPEGASYDSITWSRVSGTSANVNTNTGVITASNYNYGNTVIRVTVTVGGRQISDTCTVTVRRAARGVSIPETLTMDVGTTSTLTPTITPNGYSYDSLTWSVVSGSAVTVEDGVITAGNTTGTATVRVTMVVGNTSYTDDCEVTVRIPATGVSIPSSIMLPVGTTTTLDVTLTPEGASYDSITWSRRNGNSANVNANTGLITASNYYTGTSTIRVTITVGSQRYTSDCSVIVYRPVQSVTLDHSTLDLELAGTESATLTATITPNNATYNTVEWSVSQGQEATAVSITPNGNTVTVNAVGVGTATITATATNGTEDTSDDKTATCTVTVTQLPTGIALDAAEMSLVVDCGTGTLTATVSPETVTDPTVTWSSSNPSVASVVGGVVTPLAAGETTITATTVNNLTASCVVTVSDVVSGITIPDSLTLYRTGDPEQMTYTIVPEGAVYGDLTWTSSDENIVTVDSNGVVTPVGLGTASISVSAEYEGHTAYSNACTVNVYERVDGVTVSPDTLSLTVGGESESLTVTIDPPLESYTIEWSSSDESVATVDDGVVSPVGEGSAVITVTVYDEGTGDPLSATCSVTVINPDPGPEPGPEPGPDPEPEEPVYTPEQIRAMNISHFVDNLYLVVFDRPYDVEGREHWLNELLVNGNSGSDIVYGFLNSSEFLAKNLTDEEYITLLYRIFFDREPDAGGMATWMNALANGATRNEVLYGFAKSEEWLTYCARYQVNP